MRKETQVSSTFDQKVYKTIKNIPCGKVMTYGKIATILKTSPRAVGQALKRNPNAPIVPCHRVIKSDGTLGGYNGEMNSKKKIKLLKSEGVELIKENKNIIVKEKYILKTLKRWKNDQ